MKYELISNKFIFGLVKKKTQSQQNKHVRTLINMYGLKGSTDHRLRL